MSGRVSTGGSDRVHRHAAQLTTAHRHCFVANSLSGEIRVEPAFRRAAR